MNPQQPKQTEHSLGVSIIIVNWNTRELLRACLKSLYKSTRRVRLDIIVVDNASTDGSTEMVSQEFPLVNLVRNTENLGFARANNVALNECREDYILLLNSDTVVNDNAIDECVEFMAGHPKMGVLGCKLVYPNGNFQSSYFKFERLFDVFLTQCFALRSIILAGRKLGFPSLNYPSRYWGIEFSKPVPVDVIAGCFFLVRKPVIEEVGVLDEDFFFYGEEEEWCFRIRQKGWEIIYYPLACIVHIHGASSKKKLFPANLMSRRARLLVFEKTRGTAVAWLANSFMLFGSFIRLPIWLAAAVLGWFGFLKTNSTGQYFDLLKFHLAGLSKPVWRPTKAKELLKPQPTFAV
ncbi:MAG: glycosyltransferase family 2 protein [Verrucomicrobiota bacterium]